MKIDKQQLQEALEIVKPGLANTELIEQSTSFAFMGDKVVTYNDSISISHPVQQLDLEGAIRADELYEFIKRTDEDEINMSVSKNEVKMKAGNAKAGLRLERDIILPIQETGQVSNWTELPEEFASNLDFIKDSASKDMSRRVLTCVNVEEGLMEASDSFQIMRIHLGYDNQFLFPATLIPAENIPDIIKINPTEVGKTDGWIHFRNMEGTQLSCRVLVDDFPSTEQHFHAEGEQIEFPDNMDKILDRVMVFTKEDNLMDEEMQVLLKGNKLKVKGKNEYGWMEETAKVKYEGKKASFWITPYLLKNILDRTNECSLGEERIKFEGEDWEYVAVLREN